MVTDILFNNTSQLHLVAIDRKEYWAQKLFRKLPQSLIYLFFLLQISTSEGIHQNWIAIDLRHQREYHIEHYCIAL